MEAKEVSWLATSYSMCMNFGMNYGYTLSTYYRPFGTVMQNRAFSSRAYRYGFNGKEKDAEMYGEGNAYDFGARIYHFCASELMQELDLQLVVFNAA